MPILTAVRGIAYAARLITYRLPDQVGGHASTRTVEVMGANGWYSTLVALRPGQDPVVLDDGLIPGGHKTAGQAESYHIQTWVRKHGVPEGAQVDAHAVPVVIDEQRNIHRVR